MSRAWPWTHAWALPGWSGWKQWAAAHRYSMTWMKSMMIVTVTFRVRASAQMRSIWWLLPSTRAIQVRWWVGSRRVASSKPLAMTSAVVAGIDAASHLLADRGPGRVVVPGVGMMSAGVRTAGAMSNT